MNGKVVRLTQGRFEDATQYGLDPESVAADFAACGAQYLHVVDLDGARSGSMQQSALLAALAKRHRLGVQVGGGVRTLQQVKDYLKAGAARVVVGSLAVNDFEATQKIIKEVGPETLTIALDFKVNAEGQVRVAARGWQEVSDFEIGDLMLRYADLGIKYFLSTDVGRDGTMEGPQASLYEGLQKKFPQLEIQVSGGIGSLEHLKNLKNSGARAVILGKALYEGKFHLSEALKC
jgi:phosphoribosylformimino-5-aminoimidazole carboxamide ribotide isomerase